MAIFKYFTEERHALAFIEKGVMLLRPLSHFRAVEDECVRGDARDGVLTYAPAEGLVLTKQDGTVIALDGSFNSSAKQDEIFVYCASNKLSTDLARRFASPFCVEVADPRQLVERLKRRAVPSSQLDYEQLLSGTVQYRAPGREPEGDWALPDKLAFIKPESFAWQDEFRIAIGTRGAFAVQNVDCTLQIGPTLTPSSTPTRHSIKLKIGRPAEFTLLHRLELGR